VKIDIRRDRMTKWERWDALLNREPLDRIPVHGMALGFAAVHAGLSVVDAYTNPRRVIEAISKTTEDFGWQDLPIMVYAAMGAWELGGEVKMPDGKYAQAPMVIRLPIEKEEDVDTLEVPEDITKAGIVPLALEAAKLQVELGAPMVMGVTLGPWSFATNSAGIETVMRWVLKKPELVHKLQEEVLPFSVELLRILVDTVGADRILAWVGGTASSSNQMISPKVFENFYLPYMKRLYDEAHALGLKHIFIHICGEQNANLPFWAELDYGDPGILSFGHEVDLETAAEYFPNDIIMGNLEPAILQISTPEQVYEATRKIVEKGKRLPGGFMLAPGCELPPMTPKENVWAMMQAVSDFGWYE
jgi:uroporphyrinogen decarboxylase